MGRARLALILGSLTTFGPFAIDMYLPGLPGLARDLGTGAAQAQLTLSAFIVGMAAGQVVAGPVSDSRGRRPPLLIGVALFGLASAGCAVSVGIWGLVGLRVIEGIGGGAAVVIARAVARDLFEGHHLARFLAILMLVNGLAPVLAPLIGGQLLRVGSWRLCFFALAAIGVALLLASGLGLQESLPVQRRTPGGLQRTLRNYWRLATDGRFMGHALALGLAFGALFTYIADSPFVLERVFGLSPQLFSAAFGANAVGIIFFSQLSRLLVHRVGPAGLLTAGLAVQLAAGLVLVVGVFSGLGLVAILPSLFLVASAVGLVFPNATALALADHSRGVGAASALLGLLQFALGGAMAPLAALLPVGVAGAMAIGILACATTATVALAIGRRMPRPAEVAPA